MSDLTDLVQRLRAPVVWSGEAAFQNDFKPWPICLEAADAIERLQALSGEPCPACGGNTQPAQWCQSCDSFFRGDAHPAAPAPEPVAWIEHHKAGDNLRWDEPGGKQTPLYAHPAAPAPEPEGFDRATALVLMSAAAKSGNEGAIRLAAQLANAAPCEKCGYVHFHCRCAHPVAAPAPDALDAARLDWLSESPAMHFSDCWRAWNGEEPFRAAIDAAIQSEGK